MPQDPELLIVLVVIVLPLGAATLPNLGRSVGQAQHEFKQGLSEGAVPASDDGEASTTA